MRFSAFHRSRFSCLSLLCMGLMLQSAGPLAAQKVELEKPGIVYGIGRVEKVTDRTAIIDLGDVHTVQVGQKIALIRPTADYYVPVGAVSVTRTQPSSCNVSTTGRVKPQAGDVAMFVREFSEMETPEKHQLRFLRERMVKRAQNGGLSGMNQSQISVALRSYAADYPAWRSSQKAVVGYLTGASYADGQEETLRPLINQLNMLRDARREGSNGVAAAGEAWLEVMQVLEGPTVAARHAAAQKVVSDENVVEDKTPLPIRDISRRVADVVFDRNDEEQKLVRFLVARVIEDPPRSLELWLPLRLQQSQFPQLAVDNAITEHVRKVVRQLQAE